jgi:hypothetical protein
VTYLALVSLAGVPALYLVLLSRIRHRINPSGVTQREAVRRRQSDDRVSVSPTPPAVTPAGP